MTSRVAFIYHDGKRISKTTYNQGVKCANVEYSEALEEKITRLLEQVAELKKELKEATQSTSGKPTW